MLSSKTQSLLFFLFLCTANTTLFDAQAAGKEPAQLTVQTQNGPAATIEVEKIATLDRDTPIEHLQTFGPNYTNYLASYYSDGVHVWSIKNKRIIAYNRNVKTPDCLSGIKKRPNGKIALVLGGKVPEPLLFIDAEWKKFALEYQAVRANGYLFVACRHTLKTDSEDIIYV